MLKKRCHCSLQFNQFDHICGRSDEAIAWGTFSFSLLSLEDNGSGYYFISAASFRGMLSLENNGPGYYFISAPLTSSLGALLGTNFNPVPGSLDVIKQPALIQCQFFSEARNSCRWRWWWWYWWWWMVMVILVIVLVVMTVVVLSTQLSHTMGSFKSD